MRCDLNKGVQTTISTGSSRPMGFTMGPVCRWFASVILVILSLVATSQQQNVENILYRETGATFGGAKLYGGCRDVMSGILNDSIALDKVNGADLCTCLRTSNSLPVLLSSQHNGELVYTAILHTMLPLSDPAAFPVGEQLKWASYLSTFLVNTFAKDHIRLHLQLWDTSCSSENVARVISSVFVANMGAGILGPACGSQAILTNNFAPYLSMADVSYSAEASELSDRSLYSSFYRMSGTSVIYAKSWIDLMTHYSWKNIFLVTENYPEFQEVLSGVQRDAGLKDITVRSLITISDGKFDLDTAWATAQRSRTRIIALLTYHRVAQQIICGFFKKGATSRCCGEEKQFVFVLPGWYYEGWHETPVTFTSGGKVYHCSTTEMRKATNLTFSVNQGYYDLNESRVLNITEGYGLSVTKFKELNQFMANNCYSTTPYPRMPVMYDGLMHDSIVLYYKAFQKLQETLANSSYREYPRLNNTFNFLYGKGLLAARWALIYMLGQAKFEGISGPVEFESSNQRFRPGVKEAEVDFLEALDNLTAFTNTTEGWKADRPVQAEIRQRRGVNASENPITFLIRKNFTIIPTQDTTVVWGECCTPNSAPSDLFEEPSPAVNAQCTQISLSFVTRLGSCGRAVGFITGISISLLILMAAGGGVLWRRWYTGKIRLAKAAGLKKLMMKENILYDEEFTKWELPRECVVVNRLLGEGAFGAVYGGELLSETEDSKASQIVSCAGVAIKTLHENATIEEKRQFLAEGQLMTRFEHENIVKLLGFCTRDEPYYVVMELMMHGDLKAYVLSHRHLVGSGDPSELHAERLTSMVRQVASGMAYMARKRFVHRDIAARNCMVTINYTVKLGDFGMARETYMTDYYRVKAEAPLPVRWMAVESLLDGCFTIISDMWSFGVVLFEVITFGAMPFAGLNNQEVIEQVREGSSIQLPRQCPDELRAFIRSCWHPDTETRLTAEQAETTLTDNPRFVVPCYEREIARQRARLGTQLQGDMIHRPNAGRTVRRRGADALSPSPAVGLSQSPATQNGHRMGAGSETMVDRYVIGNPSTSPVSSLALGYVNTSFNQSVAEEEN